MRGTTICTQFSCFIHVPLGTSLIFIHSNFLHMEDFSIRRRLSTVDAASFRRPVHRAMIVDQVPPFNSVPYSAQKQHRNDAHLPCDL